MSWEVLNQILGLAAVDRDFAQALLQDPPAAARAKGFQLTSEEEQVFRESEARDLPQFSRYLLQAFRHQRRS